MGEAQQRKLEEKPRIKKAKKENSHLLPTKYKNHSTLTKIRNQTIQQDYLVMELIRSVKILEANQRLAQCQALPKRLQVANKIMVPQQFTPMNFMRISISICNAPIVEVFTVQFVNLTFRLFIDRFLTKMENITCTLTWKLKNGISSIIGEILRHAQSAKAFSCQRERSDIDGIDLFSKNTPFIQIDCIVDLYCSKFKQKNHTSGKSHNFKHFPSFGFLCEKPDRSSFDFLLFGRLLLLCLLLFVVLNIFIIILAAEDILKYQQNYMP